MLLCRACAHGLCAPARLPLPVVVRSPPCTSPLPGLHRHSGSSCVVTRAAAGAEGADGTGAIQLPPADGATGVDALECEVESYSTDAAWETSPRAVSLNPPDPPQQMPPLIHHVKTGARATTVRHVLCNTLGLTGSLSDELIAFGAVYVARPLAPGEKRVKTGRVPGPIPGVKMSKAMRVVTDTAVPPHSYVRVHENPKRHLAAREVPWGDRIIYKDQNIVVVDKPSGVPTTPTVDNLHECAISQVSAALGQAALTTSRIDLATSGLVVFGLHAKACKHINAAFSERRVNKQYKAVVWGKVEKGLVKHGFKKPGANQKPSLLQAWHEELQASASGEWQPAICEVLDCEPITTDAAWGAVAALARAHTESNVLRPCPHEITVKLWTGRTHQIRLQMAALGAPLVGDERYIPVAGQLLDGGTDRRGEASERPCVFGPEPNLICLQASRLEFEPTLMDGFLDLQSSDGDNLRLTLEAGTPWWRGEVENGVIEQLLRSAPKQGP